MSGLSFCLEENHPQSALLQFETHIVPNVLPHLRELLQVMKRTLYGRPRNEKKK